MTRVYDEIGVGYSTTRVPDPRIAARIVEALGDFRSLVNVGAGTGSYEPREGRVVAVEPSATMIRQRSTDAGPAVQGAAENLPLADGALDAALAVLTIHHWTDAARGLAEMRRVARRRVVILTWDQVVWESFWLVREYFPCICDIDRARAVEPEEIESLLGDAEVSIVPIPHDCRDGFHGAFWRRPAAYLDPEIRAGISTYPLMSARDRERGLARLAEDLERGAWRERHLDLLDLAEIDLGYRLIVATCETD